MPTAHDHQNRPGSSDPGRTARPVINGHASPPSGGPRRRSVWKSIGIALLFIVLLLLGWGIGVFMHILRPRGNEAGAGQKSIGQQLQDGFAVITNPRGGFPGKNKIVICCMGIDDNWTNSDQVYTAGARTDTLFLMTLDMDNKKATMLSIPRDTYVHIAGTNYSGKINSAYSTGGPKRTEATIQQWLGVPPDYYIVLNIDATKRMVDALGGVDVNVEHAMDYDDEWGHLHVHLKPGFQHLNGDQAVGFARFRHGNHGITPEDGDERRMYRQHILLRAMIDKAKSPANLINASSLVDTAMTCVRTDLSRDQLADLGAIFHGMDPQNDIVTASLVGDDSRGEHGEYVMRVDDRQAQLYADWLVRGDDSAGRALTRVQVANATATPRLASKASNLLRGIGFSDTGITTAAPALANPSRTVIIDGGVANHQAADDIARTLGVSNPVIVHQTPKPNKFGWTPPPAVTVDLGNDFAAVAKQQTVAPDSASASQ